MSGTLVSLGEWERARIPATDTIEIQNLSCVVHAGRDIWGRSKPQPVQVSAKIDLARPFSSAASTDSVDISTINYGTLSKVILEKIQASYSNRDDVNGVDGVCHLVAYSCIHVAGGDAPLTNVQVTCSMPKGSRYGQGTSLTLSHCPSLGLTSVVLGLHKLSVPCIIGINDHERLMKQLVVASIWMDGCKPWVSQNAPELEQLVVKTIEESAYQTLEALAEEIAGRIVKYFVLSQPQKYLQIVAGLKIRLEKPSAVPLADAPAIEIYRSIRQDQQYFKSMLAELGNKRPVIPFPLTGRLDEFLQSWKQD